MPTFTIKRTVDAPKKLVWDVISDVVAYADYAPNLSKAEYLDGDKETLRRRCYDTRGRGWNEACVLWEDEQVYSIEVDTSDYPYPFTKMQGTWRVDEHGDGTEITMHFDYRPKGYMPIISDAINLLMMRPLFNRICVELMDNWEREITSRLSDG